MFYCVPGKKKLHSLCNIFRVKVYSAHIQFLTRKELCRVRQTFAFESSINLRVQALSLEKIIRLNRTNSLSVLLNGTIFESILKRIGKTKSHVYIKDLLRGKSERSEILNFNLTTCVQ